MEKQRNLMMMMMIESDVLSYRFWAKTFLLKYVQSDDFKFSSATCKPL